MAYHQLLRMIWSDSSGQNESLIKAELGDNTARPRVSSIAGERTWPELGFTVVPEKSEREKRLGGGDGVLGFLAAANVAL
jgi:hypothetical protein